MICDSRNFSNKVKTIINRAFTISEKSSHKQFQIGCIIYNKGIISVGFNSCKTHPYAVNNKNLVDKLHAEMDAIRKVKNKEDLRGSTIVVVRKGLHGNPRTAKPCELCMEIIKDMGIKRVIYSVLNGFEEIVID